MGFDDALNDHVINSRYLIKCRFLAISPYLAEPLTLFISVIFILHGWQKTPSLLMKCVSCLAAFLRTRSVHNRAVEKTAAACFALPPRPFLGRSSTILSCASPAPVTPTKRPKSWRLVFLKIGYFGSWAATNGTRFQGGKISKSSLAMLSSSCSQEVKFHHRGMGFVSKSSRVNIQPRPRRFEMQSMRARHRTHGLTRK
jgi:hypothetical protein